MLKQSAMTPDFQPAEHQEDAVRKLKESGGRLLLAHPVGSGKTPTYIYGVETLKEMGKARHPLVVTPAGLQDNFADSVHKFTDQRAAILSSNLRRVPRADYHIVSFDKFRKNPHGYMAATGADTLVIDELHKARTEGTKLLQALQDAGREAKNVIAGTGSVANNHPHDILPQVDIVSGGHHHLGPNTGYFDRQFTGKRTRAVGPLGFIGIGPKVEEPHLKNKHVLRHELGKYVHYVDKLPFGDAPEKVVHDVEVEMSPEQNRIYKWSLGKIDPMTRLKIRLNLPPTAKEYRDILPKLTQQRQISNAVHPFTSRHDALSSAMEVPKTRELINDLEAHLNESSKHKAIVYSNFVNAGISPVEHYLQAKGIPYGKFIGTSNEGVTPVTRKEDVQDYVAGKHRVMLISGAGTEGLNLPGTTRHYTMDPHYNPEVLTQSEARGIRRGSPVKQVDVYRYRSYPKRNMIQKLFRTRDHGIDEWIYGMAEDKRKFNEQLTDLMKTGGEKAVLNPYRSYMAKQAAYYDFQPVDDPAHDLAAGTVGAVAGGVGGAMAGRALLGRHVARHQQALSDADLKAREAANQEIGPHLQDLHRQHAEVLASAGEVDQKLDHHYRQLNDLDEHFRARGEALEHEYNMYAAARDDAWRHVNPQRQHKSGWVGSPDYEQKVLEHQHYTRQVANVQSSIDQLHHEVNAAAEPSNRAIAELRPHMDRHLERLHQIRQQIDDGPALLEEAFQRHSAALRKGVVGVAGHYPLAGGAAGVALGTAAGLGGLALYRHMTRKPSEMETK